MAVCVEVLGYRVVVSSPYPGQVKKMSLVQGISRFSYVYEGLTPFSVYRVDYIGGFAGDLVPHIVAFAGGVAELFSLHHVWTDCAPLCPTRSAPVWNPEEHSVVFCIYQYVFLVAVSFECC